MKINADLVADIIPVDYPINLMIAVAWHLATRRYSIFKNYKMGPSVIDVGILIKSDPAKYRFTVARLAIEIL
jgi:hypothetical protein